MGMRTVLRIMIIIIVKVDRHAHVVIGAPLHSLALHLPVCDANAEIHKLMEVVFQILLIAVQQALHHMLLDQRLHARCLSGRRYVQLNAAGLMRM